MDTLAREMTFYGVAASPGIAIGRAHVFEDETLLVTKRRIPPRQIPNEIKRFRKAIVATHKDLNRTESEVLRTLGKQHARLIDAHRLILDDPILTKDIVRAIEAESVNAEYALSEVLNRVNQVFEAIRDEFFRERRHDLFDVGRRILWHLSRSRRSKKAGAKVLKDSLVIARSLLPTDTIHLKDQRVAGFATETGGRTSHVAILANALEIPAVVGVVDVLATISSGDEVILDGNEGIVIVRPTTATVKNYKEKQSAQLAQQQELLNVTRGPAATADGFTITLLANLDALEELPLVKKFSADGIGLFRTEFVCLAGENSLLLDQKGQKEIYTKVLQELNPSSVIIRLLDIGADKLLEVSPQLADLKGLSKESPSSNEQAASLASLPKLPLGVRGIRLILRYPKILKTQLRAILEASVYGYPKILIPMVSAIEEIREVKWMLDEIKTDLDRDGIPYRRDIAVGIMMEVPSVAIKVESFLPEVDFISVGTNDLVQYTLACDRASAELAYLYQEFHPSILQLLYNATQAAHNLKKWIGICGELVSNPLALPLLLAMGFDGFSANPNLIPKIKKQLSLLTLERSRALVQEALRMTSYEDVVDLLKRQINVE